MTDPSPAAVVPRVTTQRLLLREFRWSDFDTYVKFMNDPQSTRFVPAAPDRRSAWRMMASLTGAWMLTGAGWWAVELQETGAFVGTVGAFFRETMLPLVPETDLELGWTVFPPYWRRGIAREAAHAALRCGLARHGARRAIAQMDPTNTASIAVAKGIGMSPAGEVDFYGQPSVLYAIARDVALEQTSPPRV